MIDEVGERLVWRLGLRPSNILFTTDYVASTEHLLLMFNLVSLGQRSLVPDLRDTDQRTFASTK